MFRHTLCPVAITSACFFGSTLNTSGTLQVASQHVRSSSSRESPQTDLLHSVIPCRKATMSTTIAEGAIVPSSPPSVDDDAKNANNTNNINNTNDLDNFDNLSKDGHVTQISLRTRRDVTRARKWLESEGSPRTQSCSRPAIDNKEFLLCTNSRRRFSLEMAMPIGLSLPSHVR
jgi:hypothetical protein